MEKERARKWTVSEAVAALRDGNKKARIDIARRFPLFATATDEEILDEITLMTARQIEIRMKGDEEKIVPKNKKNKVVKKEVEEDEEDLEEEEEDLEEEKDKKKEKKEVIKKIKEKKVKKVEEEDIAEDDFEDLFDEE